MLKKRMLYLCFFSLLVARPFAQVNLQTGGSVFSLPVFNWQDDKSRLNSIVALSYNSGNGLKVTDVASNVGQGWNLIAGGVISRIQNGEPDDQVIRNGSGDADITKYPSGILYATKPASDGCPGALTNYPIYGWMNQLYSEHNSLAEDKQLDYFTFQFNGKAGMFVLNPGNIGVAQPLGDTKMKITFQQDAGLISQGIRTKITSFTIQDVDGLIYKFRKHGLTKILDQDYYEESLTFSLTQPFFGGSSKVHHIKGVDNGSIVNPWVIANWYVDEIEDALTHRKITFTYVDRTINTAAGEDISFNIERNYALISHKISVSKSPDLTSIDYPDDHLVNFNYGNARVDLTGAYVLSSVDVKYGARTLSQHQFNTSYFIQNRYGTPVTDYQKRMARLCLKSVRKIGVDLKEDSPPYLFDYYMGSNTADDIVPGAFSYAKDIWGYYNGSNSAGFNNGETIDITKTLSQLTYTQLRGLCYMRYNLSGITLNAKAGYAKNGLLKQIIYPTGGTLTYEYLQNTGKLPGGSTDIDMAGVHVSKTSSTDGGYSNGCENPITTQYNYVLANGASSLWGIEMPDNSMVSTSHYHPEGKKFKWGLSCLLGCCTYKFKYPGILSQQQAINLTTMQNIMIAISPVLNIVSFLSTINDIATLIGATNPGFGMIAAVVIDIISGLVTLVVSCFGDQSRNYTNTVFYNTDLNGIAPLPMQFKRVEVIENPATIGKTVQEFTSDTDYSVWIPAGTNTLFSAKQRFAPWAYGLPLKTTVYSNTGGYKVKETENEYNFNLVYNRTGCLLTGSHYNRSSLLKKAIQISSCKCLVNHSTSQKSTGWSDPGEYNNPASYHTSTIPYMGVDIYDVYTGRTELYKTHERTYKPNTTTEFLQNTIEYVYNDENYEVSQVKTTNSNGQIMYKNIYYTIDYVTVHGTCYLVSQPGTTNPEIVRLVQNNIISQPVETNTFTGTGVPASYLTDRATIFTTLPNGNIRDSIILEARFNQPTQRTPFWTYDANNNSYYFPQPLCNPSNPDYSLFKKVQFFAYDNNSNLVGVKDEGSREVTNIYGYDDKYVIASVINADAKVDKCAYTSFETSSYGGWTPAGAGPFNTVNNGVTGSKSFVLTGSNSLERYLNNSKAYTLSFWASNSSVVVSAPGVLTKSAPTINGFTYYEYAIYIEAGYVSLTGNCNIDELRIYPQSARMSTVTYDPLIGKTSECDANNRITYYEYDNLGRLRFIKDDYRNILKMYEYNNVSAAKQNGCPNTYYNRFISETYTRNNCGAGYIGGDKTITVAANTYSSNTSQADADAQAENYLLANGQNIANSTGACILLYYNTPQSQPFTTESCPVGYTGGTVTYSVPANKYYSTNNVTEANQKALDEIAANGQAYANGAGAVCTLTTEADWDWDGVTSYCALVSGVNHLFVQETDINPNSATYQQTRWSDVGPSDECPPSACTSYTITVPDAFATNLFVEYTPCESSTAVVKNFNTQFLLDVSDVGYKAVTICVPTGSAINFRYGSSGATVSVPEITITAIGPCP